MCVPTIWGTRLRSRYRDSLLAGRFGDLIPVRARFSAPVQTGLGPTQPPIQWVLDLFPGSTEAWAWSSPPTPPSRAEVKKDYSNNSSPLLGFRGQF